ncbi:hypothetical protein CSC81_17460, partial [Tenacibaculum discolor]
TTVDGCTSAAGTGTAAPKTTPSAPAVTAVDNCDGTSTLRTPASGTLVWSTGASTASTPVNSGGGYSVSTTVAGCTRAAGTGTARPNTAPSAPVVLVGGHSDRKNTLSTTASGTLLWRTGENKASINVNSAGDYSVT